MKKYIIEIEDSPFVNSEGEKLYRAKNFRSLVFDQNGLDKLTTYAKAELRHAHDIERVAKLNYQKGYDDGCRDSKSQKEEEFHVGDEIIKDGKRGMVVGFGNFLEGCDMQVMFPYHNAVQCVHMKDCRNTGKTHSIISHIKRTMGEEDES